MKKRVIACLIIITTIAAILFSVLYLRKNDPDDPNTYLGTWVAVEYLRTGNIQMLDSHEHLGNHIVLSSNEYYSEFVLEHFPPSPVDKYIITQITNDELWYGNKTWLFEFGIEEDFANMLCRVDFSGMEDMIGIIMSTDELICNTGSGWYRYERVKG